MRGDGGRDMTKSHHQQRNFVICDVEQCQALISWWVLVRKRFIVCWFVHFSTNNVNCLRLSCLRTSYAASPQVDVASSVSLQNRLQFLCVGFHIPKLSGMHLLSNILLFQVHIIKVASTGVRTRQKTQRASGTKRNRSKENNTSDVPGNIPKRRRVRFGIGPRFRTRFLSTRRLLVARQTIRWRRSLRMRPLKRNPAAAGPQRHQTMSPRAVLARRPLFRPGSG